VGNSSTVPHIYPNGTEVDDFEIVQWNFAQSWYFSVQAGLSIGFGLLSESEDASKLYSCFHILAGSSAISGALSMFCSLALVRHRHFQTRSEQRLAKASAALHADGYRGFTLPQIRELMLMHPQYTNAIIRRLLPDAKQAQEKITEFKKAGSRRPLLVSDLLKQAIEALPEFQHATIKVQDLLTIDESHASFTRRAWRRARRNQNLIRITLAFICMIVIGVIFSMVADERPFIEALYFAISALSTAGMVAVNTVESDAHVLFVSFFALIGVPIYCTMLGSFAGVLTDSYMSRQVEDTINGKLTEAEAEYLGHLAAEAGRDGTITISEFTELELLRLGAVDRSTLRRIRQKFRELDVNGSGTLTKRDIVHPHHEALSSDPKVEEAAKKGLPLMELLHEAQAAIHAMAEILPHGQSSNPSTEGAAGQAEVKAQM